MENNKRLVSTPRVEVGSPQYKADAAFLKLFNSYEEYLANLPTWQSEASCSFSRLFDDFYRYLDYLAVWRSKWLSSYLSQCRTLDDKPDHCVCKVPVIHQSESLDKFYDTVGVLYGYKSPCDSNFHVDVILTGKFMTPEECEMLCKLSQCNADDKFDEECSFIEDIEDQFF